MLCKEGFSLGKLFDWKSLVLYVVFVQNPKKLAETKVRESERERVLIKNKFLLCHFVQFIYILAKETNIFLNYLFIVWIFWYFNMNNGVSQQRFFFYLNFFTFCCWKFWFTIFHKQQQEKKCMNKLCVRLGYNNNI